MIEFVSLEFLRSFMSRFFNDPVNFSYNEKKYETFMKQNNMKLIPKQILLGNYKR